jgi:hypothetical protein
MAVVCSEKPVEYLIYVALSLHTKALQMLSSAFYRPYLKWNM